MAVRSALVLPDRAARLAAHGLPVTRSRFVDGARAEMLAKIGIHTIGGLVRHYPFRYLDLSSVRPIRDAVHGTDVTVVGTIHEVKIKRPRPRLSITEVALFDGTGLVIGVWFNQPWVQQRFIKGERVAFAGRVELDYGFKQIKAPFVEKLPAEDSQAAGRIIPVHRTTDGLSTGWLRRLVAAAVEDCADVPDPLPVELRIRRGLVSLGRALRSIHFPDTMDAARSARTRLAYEELLHLQLYMAMRRHAVTRERSGYAHRVDGPALAQFVSTLRFAPTDDQHHATAEILEDMASPHPMNRMLLGDVGTGKTLVATHALVAAADSHGQAAMMAPTEVLAQQYAAKVGPLLDDVHVSWALLTGSTSKTERRATLDRLESGEIHVLFGTHALLEADVRFSRLTLVVVDEQHRFGVNQRLGLRSKGVSPDLLVMTATPIPRSLALTLYGDLATSYLTQRPNSAAGVTTFHVKPHAAAPAHAAVREAVAKGQQAYVVCALVDESDTAKAKAATREAERLANQVFPDLRVGLLTGRMRPADKNAVMDEFRAGRIDVLVSTTVIEVGVDVPNATVMLIEDADRFGLAQLHQLRGRVGRGGIPGQTWLVCEPRSREGRERIEALLSTSDGFELARMDLELRGEGRILGDRQHGLPDLQLASLTDDLELVRLARSDAFSLVETDPRLELPIHRPLLEAVRSTFSDAWEWVSSG